MTLDFPLLNTLSAVKKPGELKTLEKSLDSLIPEQWNTFPIHNLLKTLDPIKRDRLQLLL